MTLLNDPNVLLIAAALSFIVPGIVGFFKGQNAPDWVPATIFFVVCVLAAGLAYLIADTTMGRNTGDTTADKLRYWALLLIQIITLGRVWYTTIWKPSGADRGLASTGPQVGQ